MVSVFAFLTLLCALPRWLRVAQREHYLRGRVSRIAMLWFRVRPAARLILVASSAMLFAYVMLAPRLSVYQSITFIALLSALAVLWPAGLPWRGRDKKMVLTARMVRLAAGCLISACALALVIGWFSGLAPVGKLAYALVFLTPILVDLNLALLEPIESRLSIRFVERAAARLRRISPTVVAITGSFGKTSTKLYAAQILKGGVTTVASPGSFNNLLGLSRAINESLNEGTEVFVAEMGTYAPGEIARMCRYFPPAVACITSIGDVHLERMKTRENIANAKSEILESAKTVVLCIDYPELQGLAELQANRGKRVVTVSTTTSTDADVQVIENASSLTIRHEGRPLASVSAESGHASNIGCAVAIALAIGMGERQVASRVNGLPAVPHRAQLVRAAHGPLLIDDTYNSNPAGASAALKRARAAACETNGALWVVTPGMIELGRRQAAENVSFARCVAESGATLIIVGHVNRRALKEGFLGTSATRIDSPSGCPVVLVSSRRRATSVVLSSASAADVVLFENDLPDHYP